MNKNSGYFLEAIIRIEGRTLSFSLNTALLSVLLITRPVRIFGEFGTMLLLALNGHLRRRSIDPLAFIDQGFQFLQDLLKKGGYIAKCGNDYRRNSR